MEQKNSGAGNDDEELAKKRILGKILTLTDEGNGEGGKKKESKNTLEKKVFFYFWEATSLFFEG